MNRLKFASGKDELTVNMWGKILYFELKQEKKQMPQNDLYIFQQLCQVFFVSYFSAAL